MTAVDPDTRPVPPATSEPPPEPLLTGICPYVAAVDGGWRSSTFAREHRCGAVMPAAILAAEKQRRLCLTGDYVGCATYDAARAMRPPGVERSPTLPRPVARTTPVVLDHARMSMTMPSLGRERVPGQAVLVILLALAFSAIVLARLTGGGVPAAVGDSSPRPSLSATTGPSTAPTNRPAQSTAATAGASASASVSGAPGSAQPSAVGTRTYKIKAGDTLIGIAAKFDTTPKAIAKLNGITNPANLKVGQVLQIP
ncbi:MAG: LysM peptidoglycan-binding domain-containing protein [Chloroflexota bacterium]